MGKIITSPVKKWPGNVILHDPLTGPMCVAFEDSLAAFNANIGEQSLTKSDNLLLPGILACIEKFELIGFPDPVTPQTFPFTPRLSSAKLVGWLVKEIQALYNEEIEIPNS